jgi:hypothetical protein
MAAQIKAVSLLRVGIAAGIWFSVAAAQAQLSPGDILVIDPIAGTENFSTGLGGALFLVNPSSGQRTVLSDFGDSTQGPTGQDPVGVAIETDGRVLVIDPGGGTNQQGALFRVNPNGGQRSLISDFGNGA